MLSLHIVMSFDTERFILEIKKRPALWNTGASEHSDRDLKVKCWEEIVDIFKEDVMTNEERIRFGDALQKKWKSIRGCFTRELNRQRMLKSGSAVGPRKREYIFFKQLKFLKKIVTIKEQKIKERDSVAVSSAEIRERVNETKTIEKENNDKLVKATKKTLNHRFDTYNQDEDELFLMSLLSTLRRVPQNNKMATKMKKMALLDEATQSVL